MNLDLNKPYKCGGYGSIAEKTITAKFVNKTILGMCNDVLSLAIYGKLNLDKKIESNLNIDKINSMELGDFSNQYLTSINNNSSL
ncbi:MAG: hypothetical protein H9Q65_01030 [Spiroplasma ixodetis]|nr:hypothetical protein [Spiroplasma ixodetis]MBP1527827.1 hypothetical protein [Spiroplasma ixodetis]